MRLPCLSRLIIEPAGVILSLVKMTDRDASLMIPNLRFDPDDPYPDSDGQPMAENTEQYEWIVKIKETLEILFAIFNHAHHKDRWADD